MTRRILITGGTGFLGKRLALDLKEKSEVFLGGRNNKSNLEASRVTGCEVLPLDVSNIESVRDVFARTKPHIVVHAAATKFVDLSEKYPMECVDINVVGSQNVARVAIDYKTEKVLGISTDKASPPIRNIYGMSKALMERMYCSLDGTSDSAFACVRYGNVAWSTGSVLTLWKRMHDECGVIETTGPEMRRFFFTIDDAVRLVKTALDDFAGIRGKVLSRKMKAAQIEDILKVWTKHKGGDYRKVQGRPGERLDEFLIGDLELPYTTELKYDGTTHYLISFNEKVEHPVKVGLSSANTDKLSEEEILAMIDNPPFEEL